MPSDTSTQDLIAEGREYARCAVQHRPSECSMCLRHALADRLEELDTQLVSKTPAPGHSEWCTGECGAGGLSSNSDDYCPEQRKTLGEGHDVEGLVGALRGLAWRLRGTHAQFTMQDSDACLAAAARLDGTEDFMPNREPGGTKVDGWLVGLPDPERSPKRPPEQLHFNPGPVPKRYGYQATLYITSKQKGVDPGSKTG